MKVSDHVKGNVNFSFYRGGYFYYLTDSGLEFPVPMEEIDGGATLLAQDKAIYFMRWIRKHIDFLNRGE